MKKEIINIALENLKITSGINSLWRPNGSLDGITTFIIEGDNYECVTEIKRELRQYQVHEIQEYNRTNENFLIVAERIFPKIKEELRELGIAYLEANGNVFIKTNGFYLFIDANKPYKTQNTKSNRAFTKTGLKVLMQFLINPQLVNKTHREIAETASVGLGNIPQVIEGLKETGHLIALDKKSYIWENLRGLIDRWVNDYATELRPKTIKGKYKAPEDWKNIHLNSENTVWGSEPAADLLTNHLRPGKFVLHTKENNVSLMRNYKLIPNTDGNLEVLDMFWDNQDSSAAAPAIIIYAELIIEGGKRNTEVAKMIFNEFIESNI